jgi:hypothetical protein
VKNLAKNTEPRKEYKANDFKVILGIDKTGDVRVPFRFESKDGKVQANFFWEQGNVELRAIVGETGLLHIAYPFVYSSTLPDPRRILASLLNRLNFNVK